MELNSNVLSAWSEDGGVQCHDEDLEMISSVSVHLAEQFEERADDTGMVESPPQSSWIDVLESADIPETRVEYLTDDEATFDYAELGEIRQFGQGGLNSFLSSDEQVPSVDALSADLAVDDIDRVEERPAVVPTSSPSSYRSRLMSSQHRPNTTNADEDLVNNIYRDLDLAELQLQQSLLRTEILIGRERRERTLRALLRLRLEQFRLRHQQMLRLLPLLTSSNASTENPTETADGFATTAEGTMESPWSTSADDSAGQDEGSSQAGATDGNGDARQFLDGLSLELLLTMRHLVELAEEGLTRGSSILSRLQDELGDDRLLRKGATRDQLASLSRCAVDGVMADRSDKCSVCLDSLLASEAAAALQCKHWHHEECLVQWLKQNYSCPICRFSSIEEEESIQEPLSSNSPLDGMTGSTLEAGDSAISVDIV